MKISDLIQKDLVSVNLKSHTAEGAIDEIVEHLYKNGKIEDKKEVLEALLKREKTGTTGIGAGAAIPHARLPQLKDPIVFVGVSKHEINFSSVDGRGVKLVVLFLTPLLETGLHLKKQGIYRQ